jgi:hypothetical protein
VIAPVSVIEFNETPAYTMEQASTQLEHLYIHVGLLGEKLNEVIKAINSLDRTLASRTEHLA